MVVLVKPCLFGYLTESYRLLLWSFNFIAISVSIGINWWMFLNKLYWEFSQKFHQIIASTQLFVKDPTVYCSEDKEMKCNSKILFSGKYFWAVQWRKHIHLVHAPYALVVDRNCGWSFNFKILLFLLVKMFALIHGFFVNKVWKHRNRFIICPSCYYPLFFWSVSSMIVLRASLLHSFLDGKDTYGCVYDQEWKLPKHLSAYTASSGDEN